MNSPRQLPIGIFDSGIGGLTVLDAVRRELPGEALLYLGDTARLPYGTKSPMTVRRYALQAAGVLVEKGIKMLVIACNTASALAYDALVNELAPLPVIGVVHPGAEAAVQASSSGRIAVIATESTVTHGVYAREIHARHPDAQVVSRAASLLVPLVEEGWTHGAIAEAVAREYLDPILREHAPDTLLLGCTHFPALTETLRGIVGEGVAIVDSAATTAVAVLRALDEQGLLREEAVTEHPVRLFATDSPERFDRVARRLLPVEAIPHEIELVDLPATPGTTTATGGMKS